MIANIKTTVIWEDKKTEMVFFPIVPNTGDHIITPSNRDGIVSLRTINSINGAIRIHAKQFNG